jgi:hypothetical protein
MSYFDEQRSALLKHAQKNGDLDLFKCKDKDSDLMTDVIDSVKHGLPNKNTSLSETWTNPKTARFYEHSFRGYQQAENMQSARVELARWVVPYGQLGIVKRIDTYMFDGTTVPPTYPPSPWSALPDFYDVRWILRLEPFVGTVQAQLVDSPISSALQGWPHPDIPQIEDYWYSPNEPNNAIGLSIIVPQAHQLRLYAQIPNTTTHRISVIGRLRGYRQRTDSAPSAINAHHGMPL